jgi:hypothetical protein
MSESGRTKPEVLIDLDADRAISRAADAYGDRLLAVAIQRAKERGGSEVLVRLADVDAAHEAINRKDNSWSLD